jgi:hypothetical protein
MKNRKERLEIYRGFCLSLPKCCLAKRITEKTVFDSRFTFWHETFKGDLKRSPRWFPEMLKSRVRVEETSSRVEYYYHESHDFGKGSLSFETVDKDSEKNDLTFGIFGLIL